MYQKLSEKDKEVIKKISKETLTDYEVKGDFIEVDKWRITSYDLLNELHNLQEKIKDMEQDIESNYRYITPQEMYD